MRKVARLHDFIEVANIKDLFWNNNSDLYPTCVPTDYIRIDKTRPTFQSPYLGTCVLRGEYNHCVYNGEFYFLTKLRVQDIEKEEYLYQLDYDVMMNFLNRGVNVKGTLIKTNREDILEECLQTTVPILSDPTSRTLYGKVKTKDETWQNGLQIIWFDAKDLNERISIPTISREDFNAFIHRVNNNPLAKGTVGKKWLAKKVPEMGWNHYAHHNPLFVLDSIPLVRIPPLWKTYVQLRLADWLGEVESKKSNLIITKQETPTDHFNVGGYVLGIRDKTVGSKEATEVSLKTINLKDLKDIVPIDIKTGRPLEPSKIPEYKLLPHTGYVTTPKDIYVLLRCPYLPINNGKSSNGCIPPNSSNLIDYCDNEKIFKGINSPQVIQTRDGKTSYLWYLNKNNLPLTEETYLSEDDRKKESIFFNVSTYTSERQRWGFMQTDYKNIPPNGFLMYQLWKPYTEWEDLTYESNGTRVLWFRTGLSSNTLLDKYGSNTESRWWDRASDELLGLWGDSKPISKLLLDLDEFNWLSIAPSEKGRDYKYHSQDYWGYKSFFPSAGNLQWYYPAVLNRMHIEWSGGNIETPYSYARPNIPLPTWLQHRDTKLQDVSIYKTIELDGEIVKGDIVTSNLEHIWCVVRAPSLGVFPYELTLDEWTRIVNKFNRKELINRDIDRQLENFLTTKSAIIPITSTAGGALIAAGVIKVVGLILATWTGGLSLAAAAGLGVALTGGIYTGYGFGMVYFEQLFKKYLDWYHISRQLNIGIYKDRVEDQSVFEDKTIVFYLYKGEYRIGIYKKQSVNLELDGSESNYIISVDNTQNKDVELSIIHPLDHGLLQFENESPIGDPLKKEIIEYALGSGKFIPNTKYHNYTWDDLQTQPHVFDLVGTNWYFQLVNGEGSLIPKSVDILSTVPDEGQTFEINDKVSTYDKINQKSTFNYYGQPFNLTTKFKFSPADSFTYSSKPIILDSKYADPDVEYKHLEVDLPNDNINVITTIPRKETRSAEKVDSSQILMMKERLLQLSMNYEQDKYANELLIGDKRLAMARQREDLDHNWYRSVAGITAQTLNVAGSVATGGLGGGIGAMQSAGSIALGAGVDFLIRYPTLMKRVDEDERNMLMANSQQLYQRRQNYEHDFKYQTLKLNKTAGSYQKPSVTNRDAQEKYNKTVGVGDAFVEVLLPSPEQRKQINYIYSTFGCECVSDKFKDTPLSIHSGMHPGLYRFSKIEAGGITSLITDTTLRDILRQILENGVKFEGCNIETDNKPVKTIYIKVAKKPQPPKVVFTADNIKDWALDKWDTYRLQTDKNEIIDTLKKVPHYGLTDEEWEKHKDSFKDIDDDTLLDLINQIIRGRETGESIVITLPKPQPTNEEVERLNQTINTLRAQITNLEEQIKSNSQICEADKQQLEEEKRALQTQLTQCQQQHVDLTKEKEGKEGQITVIQGKVDSLTLEKLDLEKQLNECKDQIKRLLAAQQTCDRINTAEIKRLKDELDKTKKARQDLQTRYRAVNEQIKTINQQKQQLQRDLTTCNANINNKENEIAALKKQLAAKQEEMDAKPSESDLDTLRSVIEQKTKQLEDLQKQCADEKTQLENAKKALETEIHQHKVDKEELEQKLNDERRRAINEKDEINRLKKQIEDSKGDRDKISELETQLKTKEDEWSVEKQQLIDRFKKQMDDLQKAINRFSIHGSSEGARQRIQELEEQLEEIKLEKASCDERIAAKNRELEQCRTELDLARKTPVKEGERKKDPISCTELKAVLNEPYTYDTKARENGWNAFLDLIFELAQNLKWEGISDIDQKLTSVREIRPVLEKLEELKNIPIIDKAIDIVKEKGWPTYLKFLNEGGDLNGNVDAVIAKVNAIKLMETTPTIHAVKALLDELNWQSYKAKGQLTEQLKTNQDLQFLFHHIYPGTKTLDLYKALYGDPNVAIIRKRFTEEVKCVAGGTGSALDTLVNYRKNVTYSVGDITKPDTPPSTPEVKPPKQPLIQVQPDKVVGDVGFYGANLRISPKGTEYDPMLIASDIVQRFEDKYFKERTSEGNGKGITGASLESWYTRYYKLVRGYHGVENGELSYNSGTSSKFAHMPFGLRKQWTNNRYVETRPFTNNRKPHMDIINNVESLLTKLDEMSINQEFLAKVISGEKRLYLWVEGLDLNSIWESKVLIPQDTIDDLNKANLLEKFIKVVHIFNKNHFDVESSYKDYTDGWKVITFDTVTSADIAKDFTNIELGIELDNDPNKRLCRVGLLYSPYPTFYSWSNDSDYSIAQGWSNTESKFVNSDHALLWSYLKENQPHEYVDEWMSNKIMSRGSGSNQCLKFLRYFYAIANNKWPKQHPWYTTTNSKHVKDNPVLCFFESLHAVANY